MQSEQDFAGNASTYFTVDGLPEHDRYGIWKDAIQCLFSVDADKDVRENDFKASIESHLFGSLMLMEVKTGAQQWARGYEQIAGNGMDHFGVGVYKQGTVHCDDAKGGNVLKHGGLLIYDLTQPFTAQTTDLENLNLVIPRSLVEDLLHQPDDHCMRFLDPSDPMVQIIRDMIISLHRNVRSLNYQQSLTLEKTIPMLLANCLNSAIAETRETAHARQNIMSMVRKRRSFRENLGSSELNPRQAAHDLGVSRSNLSTLLCPIWRRLQLCPSICVYVGHFRC